MAQEDKIRELQKRIERLENQQKNQDKGLLVAFLIIGGALSMLFSPSLMFFAPILVLLVLLFGALALIFGIFLGKKWNILQRE